MVRGISGGGGIYPAEGYGFLPNSWDIVVNEAITYCNKMDIEKTKAKITELLNRGPNEPIKTYLNNANYFLEQRDFSRAISYLEKCLLKQDSR